MNLRGMRHIPLPNSNAIALHAVMHNGRAWFHLDYNESQPTLVVPAEALPAIRELVKVLDDEEKRREGTHHGLR